MPSEVDVVNRGLDKVGAATIISLTQTPATKSSNTANRIYPGLRDDLLRSNPWNFGTVLIQLSKSSTVPAFGYDNAFAYPSDWIRTTSVHNNDSGHGTFLYREQFEIAGARRVIVTSSDEVWMEYVYRVTDPNFMQVDFVEALVLALGRDFAIPLASSRAMYNDYKVEARQKLASARSQDAMGSPPVNRPRGSWVNARGGGRITGDYHHNH